MSWATCDRRASERSPPHGGPGDPALCDPALRGPGGSCPPRGTWASRCGSGASVQAAVGAGKGQARRRLCHTQPAHAHREIQPLPGSVPVHLVPAARPRPSVSWCGCVAWWAWARVKALGENGERPVRTSPCCPLGVPRRGQSPQGLRQEGARQ